jgi:hypothetical protein
MLVLAMQFSRGACPEPAGEACELRESSGPNHGGLDGDVAREG